VHCVRNGTSASPSVMLPSPLCGSLLPDPVPKAASHLPRTGANARTSRGHGSPRPTRSNGGTARLSATPMRSAFRHLLAAVAVVHSRPSFDAILFRRACAAPRARRNRRSVRAIGTDLEAVTAT
jgi:hypothetical protein